jgi:hypothetical protein
MPEASKAKRCTECGAELELGPGSCPLCGAAVTTAPVDPAEADVERYHSNVRALRSELSRLRRRGLRAS